MSDKQRSFRINPKLNAIAGAMAALTKNQSTGEGIKDHVSSSF
ncbi:MAG: hypothetical protein AAGA60_16540 [Cyanobacteria bacterium P01_E01_bin.42]